MAVIVIGGQSRNIGKTSVACALISAMPEVRWTAIKITSHRHLAAQAGHIVPDDLNRPPLTVIEEHDHATGTNTSRYLAAGATRALLIYVRVGQLSQAMPHIQKEISQSEHVLIESNSILDHLQPDLYAIVINPEIADFKASAYLHLDRVDALLEVGPGSRRAISNKINSLREIPTFRIAPPAWSSTHFTTFVTQKLQFSGK